ncbi:MAG TPA: hypothetical protein PLD88_08250, partial [Candidatus Berkiella sp.]|nr:hypothetical protein [Candidatus Berkiella sp.]
MSKYLTLLFITLLSISSTQANDIQTSLEKNTDKPSVDSQPIKKTDLIIRELSKRIQQNKLEGSLIIGGGIAYDSINYRKNKANDIDGMFIFASRELLENFLNTHSAQDIKKILGYDDTFVYFDDKEIDYFLNEKIQVMRVAGSIDDVKITVKLTDYDSLSKIEINKPFQVLSKLKDRR